MSLSTQPDEHHRIDLNNHKSPFSIAVALNGTKCSLNSIGYLTNKPTETGLTAGTLNSYCQASNKLATCSDAIVEKTATLAEKNNAGQYVT